MLVGHVASPSVTIKDDAVRILELAGVAGPVLGQVDLGVQGVAHVLVELPGQEQAPGPVLVLIVAMAAVTGHEDDFLFLLGIRCGGLVFVTEQGWSGEGQKHDGKESSECGFHRVGNTN